MRVGSSYKQTKLDDQWDAIVIGSGMGGLTTAGLLAKLKSKRVLVLEKHYTAGGFTHTFSRPGYEWDVGVHYIGEVHRKTSVLRRVFDFLSDGELLWADMGEVYDTIVIAGDRYQFPRGQAAFSARMKEYFPKDARAIDRYLERTNQAVRHSRTFFMEKALPKNLARFIGPLLRYRGLRDARKTVNEVLYECGIAPGSRLAGVLCGQYGDYGLAPSQASFFMHAILVKHYFAGAAYPVGGSSQIARTIIKPIENQGGKVITGAAVSSVLFEKGHRAQGVQLTDGRQFYAPLVISDAGWAQTFGALVPEQFAKPHGYVSPPTNVPPSFSHAALYVGVDQDAKSLGLTPSNIWVYPHEDHDKNISTYLDDPSKPLPLAYLSFPSAKDPTFATRFPGRSTIEVIGLAPWTWFSNFSNTQWHKRGHDYETLKENLASRLLDALYVQCPRVQGHVDHAELSTPVTTKHFTSHPHGEIYGLAHTPERFLMKTLRPETPFHGFFLTGSDICTAGVGGALMGGVISVSSILRKNILPAILNAPIVHQAPASFLGGAAKSP